MRMTMRFLAKAAKWLGIAIGALLLLVIVLVGGVIAAINTAAGQREIVSLANSHSGGAFRIEGLSGTIPTDLHVARFELLDARGAWLTLTGLDLRLSLLPLLQRNVVIDQLHATTLTMARLPPPSPTPKPTPPSGPFSAAIPSLPVRVFLKQLAVDRITIAKAVTQTAAIDVGLAGAAQVTGDNQGQAHLVLHDLDGSGIYTAQASIAGNDLSAKVNLDEPTRGMLSRLASLPDLGALHLALTLDGPQDRAAVGLALSAGALTASAKGTIDIPGEAADLAIDAHAPAMKPAPGIGWQSVDVALHTTGPFTAPTASGHAVLVGLAAKSVALQRLTADIQGTMGAVSLKASLAGLAAPGLPPGLLGDTPVAVTADAVLDAPDRPVHLTISHPLLTLHVDATTKPDLAATFALDLPQLAPLAAIGHQTIQGSAHITGQATRAADGSATAARLAADIHLTQAMPQAMALTGGEAKLTADATMTPDAITLSSLTLHGADIDLSAKGSRETATQQLALDWTLGLRRLADIAPQATGDIAMTGHAQGTQTNLALTTEVTGTVGTTAGGSKISRLSGPIDLRVMASGLPATPQAQITLTGKPAGSPADIAVDAARDAGGAITATIKRLTWKSMSGQGEVALAKGATLPTGTISVIIKSLADFRFLISQPLSGSIALDLKAPLNQAAEVTLHGRDLAFAANRLAAIDVTGDVRDPTTTPIVAAKILLRGISAAGIAGGATVTARGPLTALALTLDAQLPDLKGAAASARLRATLDAKAQRVALNDLEASWHGEVLRLLGPARVDFGSRMAVDRLRLALGAATIDAAGEVSPRLNLHVALADVTPALIAPFAPSLHVAGRIDAEAALTGTTAAPAGTVTLHGTGLRETTGPAASLPAATLTARAVLHGRAAALNVALDAGSHSHVTVTGTAPIAAAAAMDLRIGGKLDLALIDPDHGGGRSPCRGRAHARSERPRHDGGAANRRQHRACRRRFPGFRPRGRSFEDDRADPRRGPGPGDRKLPRDGRDGHDCDCRADRGAGAQYSARSDRHRPQCRADPERPADRPIRHRYSCVGRRDQRHEGQRHRPYPAGLDQRSEQPAAERGGAERPPAGSEAATPARAALADRARSHARRAARHLRAGPRPGCGTRRPASYRRHARSPQAERSFRHDPRPLRTGDDDAHLHDRPGRIRWRRYHRPLPRFRRGERIEHSDREARRYRLCQRTEDHIELEPDAAAGRDPRAAAVPEQHVAAQPVPACLDRDCPRLDRRREHRRRRWWHVGERTPGIGARRALDRQRDRQSDRRHPPRPERLRAKTRTRRPCRPGATSRLESMWERPRARPAPAPRPRCRSTSRRG